MKPQTIRIAAAVFAILATTSYADDIVRPDSHGPIGVMGDHTHARGEWMLSYRFMTMDMQGNLKGSSSISPDAIVTTEANRFSGMPGMPPTLRIVPLNMSMDMHMLGLMYAPSDRVTLMFMANYIENSMQHVTYAGGMGTNLLGNFNTRTSGWGDASVAGLINLWHNDNAKWHAVLGVTVPTGSSDETGEILTPMGMTPTVRLPYPMQLSSDSFDPIVGLSMSGGRGKLGWGGQWRSVIRVSDNGHDYQLGDEHRLTGWLSYRLGRSVSGSLRAEFYRRDDIDGQDPNIAGPVQTADPARQAARRVDVGIGLNIAAQGVLSGWRLGIEYLLPIDQQLDGPQLKTDKQWLAGLQKAF